MIWRIVAAIALVGGLLSSAQPAAAACGWPIKADGDLVNIAWPDEGAQYWVAPFYAGPGSAMTIRGRFPRARYMSFHVYEGSMAVDAVTDHQLVPKSGSNPFVPRANRLRGGAYEIRVVLGERPTKARPNTLYARSLNGEPNVSGFILYRIYLPERDVQGGVDLPEIRYADAAGSSPLPCPPPSSLNRGVVNEAIRTSSLPASWPAPRVSRNPTWGLARSGASTTTAGPVAVRTGNPFFANFDNVYLSLLAWRDGGDVLAFRAKAPTYARTRGARVMPSGHQVRYWSVCTNDFPTTRYVACRADEAMKVDEDGYFTIVITDPAHKPKLRRTDNWLPAGAYPDYFVLYRQMLPDASFARAIARSKDAASAQKTMGPYYPKTHVCAVERFEKDRCGLSGST